MGSRIILTTFARRLNPICIVRRPGLLTNHTFPFKNQVSFVYVKTFDKDLPPKEEPKFSQNTPKPPKFKEELIGTNPDVFGNADIDESPPDPGDVKEDDYIQNPSRRMKKGRTREYAKLIKDHLNNNRLKEALDVLEVQMLEEDRVKPENYIYNLLISGCAKAGYTKKAFQLFNKMKQRNLNVKGGTYTSLFNACANAPSIADGLTKANRLREIMLEKAYEPNATNYNAMIKAYGRNGDTKTAYMLADEMLDKKLKVNTDTFNFLLQACASDKRYGFRHALLTWHRMYKNGLSPDYYSFNLMLRCVRDTSIGDMTTMQSVLRYILGDIEELNGIGSTERLQVAASSGEEKISDAKEKSSSKPSKTPETANFTNSDNDETVHVNPFSQRTIRSEFDTPSLQTNQDTMTETIIEDSSVTVVNRTVPETHFNQRVEELVRPEFQTPNLLSNRPHLGSLLSIDEVTQPHERLLLLGGFSGFLQEMKKYGITPGIETFTALLEVIPPTYAAEKQLITMIRKIGLKADIDFFNILIKKRSMRFDYEGAKEVLSMIQTAGLYPDIVTYGVLALGCQTQEAARELIAEMRNKHIRMNAQILGAMLRQGCAQKAFPYITEILQISLDENIRPNDVFLRHLDNFYKQCAKLIDMRHHSTKTKAFKKEHAQFCSKYRLWQEEQGIGGLKLEDAFRKIKQRPYQQYSEEKIDGVEDIKNSKLARKSKMRKYIKKIKVSNLRGDDDIQSDRKVITDRTKMIEPA